LPGSVGPGPNNPLGTHALNLARPYLRIHGTNEPHTIGHAASDGCIRMHNRHIAILYDLAQVGAQVTIER
jgi:lipoprotein-anchoring transpeptidase ErfK/SrfK